MPLEKPVSIGVEGHAVVGRLELVARCELRLAAGDAVFGVFCRRWGIPLMGGGTTPAGCRLGDSPALDVILTGLGI